MINKTYLKSIVILGGALLLLNTPSAFVQALTFPDGEVAQTTPIVSYLIPLIIFNSFGFFVYGLLRYGWGLYKKNDPSRKYGKKFMFWSAIVLFVTIAFWGFIAYTSEVRSIA